MARERQTLLTEESRQRIAAQLAARDAVRAQREADPAKAAWLKALDLYPHVRSLGLEISNPGNVAEQALAHHIAQESPVPLVGFWGEGGKPQVDGLDRRHVAELVATQERVKQHYNPGASVTLILANRHGEYNGHIKPGETSRYLQEVAGMAQDAQIATRWLSDLYDAYGLTLPDPSDPIDTLSKAGWVYAQHRDQYYPAARHNKRGVDQNKAGYHYVRMRLQERGMLTQEFPHSFLLINGTKMTAEPLLPRKMPIIYSDNGSVWFRRERQ